jgi:pyrimidine operon attenuation protein / uracil phosphoribosyltransferase
MVESQRQLLMDESAVEQAIGRMAREIGERVATGSELLLVGIHRRGVHLAHRLAEELGRLRGAAAPPVGTLDITLYRDDLMAIGPRPVVGETRLPTGGIDGRVVVIVDDVCYTGRTVRAALDELADFGRPARILLCVLVDRGGRELPIQPDIVGRQVEISGNQRVDVLVQEIDQRVGVELFTRAEEG